jgi:hypothetical protein
MGHYAGEMDGSSGPNHRPKPLVSDAEVDAAMEFLNRASDLAGRHQPIPRTIMRCGCEQQSLPKNEELSRWFTLGTYIAEYVWLVRAWR